MRTSVFKIIDMHCSSCSINIDGQLEDQEGIKEASTSYVKAETKVIYDENLISSHKIIAIIKSAGYSAMEEKPL